ncbi:MAG: PKD domain-containing protein [Proteiniphilum sp.]|nr:PKD domain-containing protein [Proteiniphilum sp.]
MKNKIKQLSGMLLLLFIMAACSPQELDNYGLDSMATLTDDQVSFTQTVSPSSDNMVTFTSTTQLPASSVYTLRWDLGNGSSGNKASVTGIYPFAGDYTVTLSIHFPDGSVAKKSVVVNFEDNDYSLLDTPAYRNLTGGADDADGKTWVFDQHNNFAAEVAAATGFAISGHMGLGPINSFGQSWWGAAANDKASWTLYSYKFTFIQNGVQLKIENSGDGYGRKAVSSAAGFNVTGTSGDDAFFPYPGGDYTFSIDESGTHPKLTLSGNAFMGYYCGHQEYEIVYQTEEVMALVVHNQVEQQDWCFVFCREELNVPAPPVAKELKAIPLSEDFEGDEVLAFKQEDMGGAAKSAVIGNPVPLPINESSKVYRYWKSTGFYSNLSFTAPDYKFDLTTQNKVRMKVFIPSFNDYTTENTVAGDWIANKKLLPQLAVKLQDGDHPAPWEGQTEIVKANLELDKWLELEFDFSTVANREDYDRIVIQFGAEGHAGPGFFYLDDFEFSE